MPFLLFPYPLLHSPPRIPYSICLHPQLQCTLILPSLQEPCVILHLSSCSIFQQGSFPLPMILVDFDSSSTLNSNNPNLPISNTSHTLLAYFLTFINLSDVQFRFIYCTMCLLTWYTQS